MKPFITCFMISSIDGRIDCDMVERLEREDEYEVVLNDLRLDATISGKKTAVHHYVKDDKYVSNGVKVGKEVIFNSISNYPISIIMDNNGTLTWESNKIEDSSFLIALSENVKEDYLDYLRSMNISFIVCGKDNIELSRLVEILNNEFNINRLGIVGGGSINGSFLKEGLLDQIDLILAPGVDGRIGQPSIFDALTNDNPIQLDLLDVRKFDGGSVHLRYKIRNQF